MAADQTTRDTPLHSADASQQNASKIKNAHYCVQDSALQYMAQRAAQGQLEGRPQGAPRMQGPPAISTAPQHSIAVHEPSSANQMADASVLLQNQHVVKQAADGQLEGRPRDAPRMRRC